MSIVNTNTAVNESARLVPLWENIPAELRAERRWVLSKDKRPIDPRTGRNASSTDPETWASFDEVVSAFDQRTSVDGIALATGDGIVAIDFDGCVRSGNGKIATLAREAMTRLGCYSELSQSGT